ncbi:hypothetical protein ACFW9S_31885 [Streptomyces anulatus]|uniref:hypothetical protein n=1 Tax=Streptomyces anulatus TaxID=1892 RepID=UPI0036777820
MLTRPSVLTNAVRYADQAQRWVADVLDAARLLRPIDRRRLDYGERWLKSGATMTKIAERVVAATGGGRACAVQLIADPVAVAEACNVAGRGFPGGKSLGDTPSRSYAGASPRRMDPTPPS